MIVYDGILLTRPRQNLQNIEQRSIKNNHIELLSCKYQISKMYAKIIVTKCNDIQEMKLYNYVLLKYQNVSKFKFINHLQYVKYTF